ncbi:MAG: excinuclease ABC subunit UvrC [Gammaproteobacteria bacterium]|nr:excinuclease ABC subunit UvrC [Gammaproteobacteria bacterium]
MFDYKAFLATLTTKPGVYQMFDAKQQIIYIGKAKRLKTRVRSYFTKSHASGKTHALVKQIHDIKVIVTRSESEALILENNLIKRHRPRYNVLFRDDKSYPYIYLSSHDDYPRLDFYRGSRKGPGRFFGPYPSVKAVRQTLNLLQKLFKLRSCRDTFFRHRSRPCLQYQINRCTAPCVNLITKTAYQKNVNHAVLLLQGKEESVITDLSTQMEKFAQQQHYEQAAHCRDQIANIRQLQAEQHVVTAVGDVDAVVALTHGEVVCVQVLMVRHGQLLGKKSFFPRVPTNASEEEIIVAFVSQYYLDQLTQMPEEILFKKRLREAKELAEVLSQQAKRRIKFTAAGRGDKAGLLAMATLNAKEALATRLADRSGMLEQFEALEKLLDYEQTISRIECFDVSHTQGEATVASCVVFGPEGALKTAWRRFNISNITAGDDYAALRQALERHYRRLKEGDESQLPDLLMVDGGRAQLQQAKRVFETLQISHIPILGIAKGPTRKAGLETLHFTRGDRVVVITPESMALRLLQQIRDESHRFAITGHRQQRDRRRQQSVLQEIPGIGAKRRQQLLNYFGGLQGVQRASIEDLARVTGVNRQLAEIIYHHLRG